MTFRILLLSLLLGMLCSLSLSGQIREIPLLYNPVLEKHATQQDARFPAPIASATPSYGRSDALCVASGRTYEICLDTSGTGANGTITISACQPWLFGEALLVDTCIYYTADPGLLEGDDEICVEICNEAGECEEQVFTMRVHRPAVVVIHGPVLLLPGEDTMFCIVPDPLQDQPYFQLEGPVRRKTGRVITLNDCMRYVAARFAGGDTVLYLAHYDQCLTDSFIYTFRTIADTLELPFFDDFNSPGPWPDPRKWLDDNTYVNKHLGKDQVSVAIATLDGLDERGIPHPGEAGPKDTLTSAYLDLSPYINDNVILSFYYQPGGIVLAPPETNDSLLLEYKNLDGNWVTIASFPGINPFIPSGIPPFQHRAFGVGNAYKYNGFQFRFRNLSSLQGAVHQWHVAYVRVGRDLPAMGNNTDITFTDRPGSLLKQYTAMPWRHFHANVGEWLNNNLPIRLYNHSTSTLSANPSSLEIHDRISGQVILDNLTLLELPPVVPVNQRDLAPGRHNFDNTLISSGLVNTLNNLSPSLPGVRLEMQYSFDQDQENIIGDSVAIRNNIASRITDVTQYFAYDDGSAESAMQAFNTGSQIAQQFTSVIDDTIRAVQFHFPRYNFSVESQFFNLRIWKGSLTSSPVYQEFFVRPFYPEILFQDSINAYTTYVLFDEAGNPKGVPIPAGDFFVGWQQGTADNNPIAVGFDKNNPQATAYSWFNISGFWQKFPAHLVGALMIRPVFSDTAPNHTPDLVSLDPEAHPLEQALTLFPNPNPGRFKLDAAGMLPDRWHLQVWDMSGRLLVHVPYTPIMDISGLPDGNYVLTVTDEKSAYIARRLFAVAR